MKITAKNVSAFILLAIVTFIVFGVLSILLGQDLNWDLRNYHFYNPYFFLKNRLLVDMAPAQLQTFFNPYLDLLHYFLIRYCPPKMAGFIIGGIQGMNFLLMAVLIYIVADIKKHRIILSLLLAAASVYAANFISELGTTFNDNIVSLFVLLGLIFILRKNNASRPFIFTLVAGLFLGISAGLKLDNLVYYIGVAFAVLLLDSGIKNKIKEQLYLFSGLIAGLLASSGFWFYKMFSMYGNPFFPLYNNIFHSSYNICKLVTDKFIPDDFFQWIAYPLVFTFDPTQVSQLPFFDMRFMAAYIALFVILIYTVLPKIFKSFKPLNTENRKGIFIIIFFSFSYLVWMILTSSYRYALLLELLCPLVILLCLKMLPVKPKLQAIIMILIIIPILLTVKPAGWQRAGWTDSFSA